MHHYKSSDFKTTNWSGGTTTELFIWPEGSSYAERNFDFRLSTATVEVDESEFTSLEGVSRTLMVLDGEMKLDHEDHHSTTLLPFQFDEFNGGWKTSSHGQCVDFNLMCRGTTKGTLRHISMMKNSELRLELKGTKNLLYLHEGTIECGGINLDGGELLDFGNEKSVLLTCWHGSEMVLVEVG